MSEEYTWHNKVFKRTSASVMRKLMLRPSAHREHVDPYMASTNSSSARLEMGISSLIHQGN